MSLSSLENLPNEILVNILRKVTVFDQICVALCSKQLGALVVILRHPKSNATGSTPAAASRSVDSTRRKNAVGSVDGDGQDGYGGGNDDDRDESDIRSESSDGASWLLKSKSTATYKPHGKKEKATLELLRRLLGWAPKSLGICQFCVLYRPKASEYWNKQMSVVGTLMALQLLKDLVDAELGIADHLPQDFGAWVNNCTLTRAYDWLYLTKEVLHEELGSDGSTDPVIRWSATTRDFEVVDCLVNQRPEHLMYDMTPGVASEPSERSMILTMRRFANRCPECSLQEVESEIPAATKIRGVIKQIQRLRELREVANEEFSQLAYLMG